MKIRFFVVICAATMFAACCGNSGKQNSETANEKTCCKAHAEKTEKGVCPHAGEKTCCKPIAELKKVIGAQVFIKAEKIDNFLAMTNDLIEKSRAEEGCISYCLYQDPKDNSKFFFFEEWKNQAAVDFHFATEHFVKFGETLNDCSSEPAIITVYSVKE